MSGLQSTYRTFFGLAVATLILGVILYYKANQALDINVVSDNLTPEKARDVATVFGLQMNYAFGLLSWALGTFALGITFAGVGFAVLFHWQDNRFKSTLSDALEKSFGIMLNRLNTLKRKVSQIIKLIKSQK